MAESYVPVSGISILRFEGVDAARFLQGYLTCNTQKLTDDSWTPAALCNLQGRVMASGWARGTALRIDMLVHRSLAASTLEFLAPYQKFSRTRSRQVDESTVTAIISDRDDAAPDFQLVDSNGQPHGDESDFWASLNRHRLVVVSDRTQGEFLPHALGLVDAGAVAFDKGCYLGQEIVARAEHRGTVKKHLVLCVAEVPLDAQPMEDVFDAGGGRVGRIVQLASMSALVVANRELDTAAPLHIGAVQVWPSTV